MISWSRVCRAAGWKALIWGLRGLRGLGGGSARPNLGVELQPADAQVHPCEALVCSDGVDLDELVLPYGGAGGPVRLVVVQVEGLL